MKISKVSQIIPDSKNFNAGNPFGESLIAKSFQKFGAGRSILLDKNNKVIAGNKSLQKFAEQGLEDVQIVESDGKKLIAVKRTDIDLDTPEGREMALADNATAKANIDWDFPNLEMAVQEFDLKPLDWGVKMPHEVSEDDYVIPETIETDIITGDLFEIGQHRLLCGDSTNSDDVAKVMQGQKADISIQSPPYNIGKTPNGDKQKYASDEDAKSNSEYLELIEQTTTNACLNSVFTFVNIQPVAGNKLALIEYLSQMKEWFCDYIIWDKMAAEPAMGENVLNSRFEFVYVFGENAKRRIGVKKFRGNLENIIYIKSRQDKEFSSVHKATYPVAFPSYFIDNFSVQSCLDLFCGSGTTMVAGHQLNRKVIGIEISPQYCQIIVERMLKLDPSLEVKKNGQTFHVQQSVNVE